VRAYFAAMMEPSAVCLASSLPVYEHIVQLVLLIKSSYLLACLFTTLLYRPSMHNHAHFHMQLRCF
jgi:hypothetical protein